MLPPGSTIGMLGGGQLGRMAALAAARLGYHMHIYTPHGDDPAIEVSRAATVAGWDDREALAEFAAAVDVITLEFENVPVVTVEFLADLKPVFPDQQALAVAQDRVAEKSFINGLGIVTAPWRAVNSATELKAAVAEISLPAFAKTSRLGYDGKGQIRLEADADAAKVWQSLGAVPLILEGAVAFAKEVSLVMARGQDGAMAFYPLVENEHRNGILHQTTAPAEVSPAIESTAQAIVAKIASGLNYVGVLAVELFLTEDGQLLVNEIAPRPHNSGHWTIDACQCSQFEQQIRAICGLPLGSTEPHSRATMLNLIGDECEGWAKYLADPSACLHLYGKTESRPGRKMGHVTWLKQLTAAAPGYAFPARR
jgi:5-(carboxyamino)imidazole ribonucleotide synthase